MKIRPINLAWLMDICRETPASFLWLGSSSIHTPRRTTSTCSWNLHMLYDRRCYPDVLGTFAISKALFLFARPRFSLFSPSRFPIRCELESVVAPRRNFISKCLLIRLLSFTLSSRRFVLLSPPSHATCWSLIPRILQSPRYIACILAKPFLILALGSSSSFIGSLNTCRGGVRLLCFLPLDGSDLPPPYLPQLSLHNSL